MSIDNELDMIKNNPYMETMRDAIHDGIKKGYDKSVTAENYAAEVKDTYDNILLQWDSDPNKDPELVTVRDGEATLNDRLDRDKTEYAEGITDINAQLAQIPQEINKGIATNNISNGGAYQRMAVASFTFDDGPIYDYTLLRPVLDEYGIKGTFYINTDYTGYDMPKLTDVEIKALSEDGHEIGSHTASHSQLSMQAINKSISVGDTTIEIKNSSGTPFVKAYPTGTKIRVRDTDIIFTAIDYSLENSILTLTLDKPSEYAVAYPKEVYLHEDSVLEEVLKPKQYLESLGIPCYGLAYPWGATTPSSRRVIQSNFIYAREATNGVAGTNGGVVENDEYPFKQFNITSNELIVMTESDVDSLITKVKSEKGLLVFLGHASGWNGLESKLRMAIEKVQAAGIPIMPLHEALNYHANTINLGDFSVSKMGVPNSGATVFPRGYVKNSTGIIDYPVGVSYCVSINSDNGGFPTSSGVLETVKPVRDGNGSYITFQRWYEMDTTGKLNRVYFRIPNGNLTWENWAQSNSGLIVEKSNTHGHATPYSEFLPNKVLFEAITGGDLTGFPEQTKGLLQTLTVHPNNGYYKQLYYQDSTNKIFIRGITAVGVSLPWQRLLVGDVYSQVSLGSQTIPANGYIDVAVPNVIVKNADSVNVNSYSLTTNINYTYFVSGGAVYVRLINMSANPITYTPTFTVSVISA